MNKGVKFRAYPNKEQQNLINRTFGCCRLVYNKGLDIRNATYKTGGKLSFAQTSAMLPQLKRTEEFSFLKEVDSVALQQSLRDLDRAFVNFFQKRAKHPQFKSKHDTRQSYRTINQGNNIRIAGKYLKLPKLGYVKIKQSMEVGHINHVTIERTPTGKYFVILNVDFEPDQRNDFLQKQSTILVSENQTICIEDLNIKGMVRNHKLAQHIASCSWSKFFTMLEYKATWHGNDIIRIPTMYPSSQICSCCGYQNPLVKNLSVREWECPKCHTKHDRDKNAAINILNKGLSVA